jgi:hypothetical protein
MALTVSTQYYHCKTSDRQAEIDECLLNNLNHACISKVVLFKEYDAPSLPQASVPLEVVESNERITYVEWFRWVQRQGSGIGLLLNADIYLDEGLENLAASFDSADTFLALTRYNPSNAVFHLNYAPIGPRRRGTYRPMRSCRRASSKSATTHEKIGVKQKDI